MRFFVIAGILILFFQPGKSRGQTPLTVRGTVVRLSGEPLPGVSLQLVRGDTTGGAVVRFAVSDAAGRFVVAVPTAPGRSWLLIARAMGYAADTLRLPARPDGPALAPAFRLRPQSMVLNEVVVRKAAPMVQKKDTLVYDAKSFSDGSERTVEELLKKLPGLNVDSDGKITYQGKPVQKVMVEGEEFFSRNYKLITRSMSAGLLSKIEAIDNYTANPLLRDLTRSGQVVLNLNVDPGLRLKLFGNASAGGGTPARYDAQGTLFSLAGRVKVGLVGSGNNIGTDPLPGLAASLEPDDNGTGQARTEVQVPPPGFRQATVTLPILDAARYTLGNRQLGGLNANLRFGKKLALKWFAYTQRLDDRYFQASQTDIRFPGAVPLTLVDSAHYARRGQLVRSQLRAEYQPTENLSVWLLSRGNFLNVGNQARLTASTFGGLEAVALDGRQESAQTDQTLTAVRRLRGRQALVAELS